MMDILERQYKTPENLNKRIGLYRYSTSEISFHEWIGTLLPRQKSICVLELGCGTGILWKSLINNFPDSRIVLSDRSPGMLEEAKINLKGLSVEFREIDFHSIPFEDGTFDLIISNHNLYHAEDLDKVLLEIKRVLNPRGTFLCSTNSANHLMEMKKILANRGLSLWPNSGLAEKFGMENGKNILSRHYGSVYSYSFRQKLHITDPEAVINYLLSMRNDEVIKMVEKDRKGISEEIGKSITSGLFYEVGTDAGVFLCHK